MLRRYLPDSHEPTLKNQISKYFKTRSGPKCLSKTGRGVAALMMAVVSFLKPKAVHVIDFNRAATKVWKIMTFLQLKIEIGKAFKDYQSI